MLLLLPLVGIFIGFISGFFGIGGGTILVPLMISFGYDVKIAAGISILQMFFSAVFGSYQNYKAKTLKIDKGIFAGLGGLCGGLLSGFIVNRINPIILEYGLLITLLIAIIKVFKTPTTTDNPKDIHRVTLFVIGFFISIFAMSMGVGGAIFLTPILVGFFNVDIKKSISLGLFFVMFSSLSGLISMAFNHLIDYKAGLLLSIGSVIGVYFGTKSSHKISRDKQKKLLLILYSIMFLLMLKKVIL